jgi:hypothetical protein
MVKDFTPGVSRFMPVIFVKDEMLSEISEVVVWRSFVLTMLFTASVMASAQSDASSPHPGFSFADG